MPKIMGSLIMSTLVYLLLVKFAYPRVIAWLDGPAGKQAARARAQRPSANRAS
jgi:hypothetical protein